MYKKKQYKPKESNVKKLKVFLKSQAVKNKESKKVV